MSAAASPAEVLVALRSCRLLHAASDTAVEALSRRGRLRAFTAGETIATEGEPAKRFGVVVSGRVRVYQLSADGHRTVLETSGLGGAVLAVAALAGGRNPANVEAIDDCALFWLPRDALFQLMGAEPAVARSVVTDLADRVLRLTGVVRSLSLDVPARLAAFLFQRALAAGQNTDTGLKLELGSTKAALAESIGTTPETLSRAFARLAAEGLLVSKGRVVTVFDVGALARRGAGYEEG